MNSADAKKNIDSEHKHDLSYVIRDGITTQILVTLTSGAFLIAFALELGASNLVIGLLASIAAFAQLIQLPAIYVVEKVRKRKTVVIVSAALSRLMLVILIAIPFFANSAVGIPLMLLSLTLFYCFGAVGGSAWNSWMKDLIPQKTMGAFFSKRMKISMIFAIVFSLAASYFLDYWNEQVPYSILFSYAILFSIGLISGIIGLFFVSRIPETPLEVRKDTLHLFDLFKKPFKDINFRNLLSFVTSWSFAVNLAQPFFIVYMVQLLGYSMKTVILLTLLNQFITMVFFGLWGKYVDKFSNKSVLSISGPLLIFSILGWTFTTLPDPHQFTFMLIVLLHVTMGVATAGVLIANGNISLKLAPKGEATSYLATNSVLTSLAAGIAPIVGGVLVDFFSSRELEWTLTYRAPDFVINLPTLYLTQWDFFFFFAFIIGVYSLHRLSVVREEGEVNKKVIMDELFSDFREQAVTFASMQGMRRTIGTPFTIITNASLASVRQITKITKLPKKIFKKVSGK